MYLEDMFDRLIGAGITMLGLGMLIISVEGFFNPNAFMADLVETSAARIGMSLMGTGFAVFITIFGIEAMLDMF